MSFTTPVVIPAEAGIQCLFVALGAQLPKTLGPRLRGDDADASPRGDDEFGDGPRSGERRQGYPMNAASEAKLWYWQRISAMPLALFVARPSVTLIYAVRGGLTGAEILGRTRGSWIAALFYGASC